jgi:hypothetical protein
VGGKEINHEMTKITPACMETLRHKRIIMYAKSFGGSLVSGYRRLKSAASPYALEAKQDSVNFGVGDFTTPMLIDGDCGQRYPTTARIDTLGNKLLSWAGDSVDAAFVFWHLVTASIYSPTEDYRYAMYYYMHKIDSLRTAYPHANVFYGLVGCVGELDAARESNMTSVKFNETILNYKRGLAPIYDHTSILSTDTLSDDTIQFNISAATCRNCATIACIDSSCLRYSKIACPDSVACPMIPGSGLHPNAAYEKRMALGMTLLLAKMFCPSCFETLTGVKAPAVPAAVPAFAISVNPSYGTFRVTAPAPVHTVWLYNAAGEQVAVLAAERGAVNWKAQRPALGSGIYFVSIDQGKTRVKLVLIR